MPEYSVSYSNLLRTQSGQLTLHSIVSSSLCAESEDVDW